MPRAETATRRLVAAVVAAVAVIGCSSAGSDEPSDAQPIVFYDDGDSVTRLDGVAGDRRGLTLDRTTRVLELLAVGDTVFALTMPADAGDSFIPEAVAFDALLEGPPHPLGPSLVLLRPTSGSDVWLWVGANDLRQVSPQGEVTATASVPPAHPLAALPDGFVIAQPDYRLARWNASTGQITPIGSGPDRADRSHIPQVLLGVRDDTVIWFGCAEDRASGIHIDAAAEERTIALAWDDGSLSVGAVSPDGRSLAAVVGESEHRRLILIDIDAAQVIQERPIDFDTHGAVSNGPAWAARSTCIVWTSFSGATVWCTTSSNDDTVDVPRDAPLAAL